MKRLAPVHAGEVLLEDFMKPNGLTAYRVAKDIGVPALRINQIVKGERGISADTALRLARYFGTSAEVWVRIQARYELETAQNELERRISKEVKVFRAA
jgi:antitoxin HigA-1